MTFISNRCGQLLRSDITCLSTADRSPFCSLRVAAFLLLAIITLLTIRQFCFLENNYLLIPFTSANADKVRLEDEFDWINKGRPVEKSYPSKVIVNAENDAAPSSNNSSFVITILLWTRLFGDPFWGLGKDIVNQDQPFRKPECPVSNCYVTTDRNRLSDASAVLVSFRDDFKYSDRPSFRPPNQHWVFALWESPEHTYSWNYISTRTSKRYLDTEVKGFFNWTMTYRLDSDIPLPYGRFVRNDKPYKTPALSKKRRTAVVMVSNCFTASHRDEFVRELRRFIDVEIIGGCSDSWLFFSENLGDTICQQQHDAARSSTDECREMISNDFKFYLAIENSLCVDYVTEKFFRAAALNLIPIVMTGANMSHFAPPHSYINAADFESVEQLARYLQRVGSDEELYKSYFWWKRYYDVSDYMDYTLLQNNFCNLCSKLNKAKLEPAKYAKVYDDLEGWWMGGGKCRLGDIALNQQFRNLLERTLIVITTPLLLILTIKCFVKLSRLFITMFNPNAYSKKITSQ